MAELNDKLITYGNLSTFYDKLQEQGLGGNAIEDASVLPDASENKSKLIRLESDDNVYVSELKSRTSTTTNRLPDEEQIDKAYLYNDYGNGDFTISRYKGDWRIICADGEIDGYGWIEGDEDEWYLTLTKDNAVNINNATLVTYAEFDEGNPIIDIENRTITTTYYIDDFELEQISQTTIPIPAIYNAPESAQIGNATCKIQNLGSYTYVYTGVETTIEVDEETLTVYKWDNGDVNSDFQYCFTTKPASEMYFNNDSGILTDVKCYLEDSDEVIFTSLYIPQLNAPDSEQVGNATYTQTYDGGEGVIESTYLGEKNIQCTDGVYSSYIWLQNRHPISDLDEVSLTKYSANNYYSAKNVLRVYGGDLWGIITVEDNEMYANNKTVAELSTIMDENESSWFEPNADSNVLSTVKYQRTEVTEEWDWEKVATEDELDELDTEVNTISTTLATKANKVDFIIPVNMQTRVTDWTVLNNAAEGIYRVKVVVDMMGTSVTMLEGWATVTNSMGTIAQTLVLTQMRPSAQGSPLTIHNRVSVNNGTTWSDYEFNLGVINDSHSSTESTYSSNKIESLISALETRIAALENPNA